MNKVIIAFGTALVVGLASSSVGAYTHANRAGGSTSHAYGEGTEHTNAYGGSTDHAWGGGTEHTNMYGGQTDAKYGEGASHTTPYGATAYAPPPDAYAYHPPTTVNYYGAGCYNCGGYSTAGAVAAGVVVGAAAASAADASQQQAQTTQAYDAGVAAGAAESSTTYVIGNVYPSLPGGCATPNVRGTTYYLCGNTWFQPTYGANGVYYKVVPAP
jgi:hypothetical protein